MKKFLFLFLTITFSLGAIHLIGQSSTVDTIFSMEGKFNRSKIHLGTDTMIDYKESQGERKINSTNTRTIEKVKVNNKQYYKITTQNIPVENDHITTVSLLLDYTDLHLVEVQLKAKEDSGYVEFQNQHFTGWSQLPKEERKIIDLSFKGVPLFSEGNRPFVMGLLSRYQNKVVVLPFFALFSNTVKWKTYMILGKEDITIKEKHYQCWKIDAGKMGPPGYTSYHWYESKTGRLVKAELVKEGVDLKFVSELQF